jgi:endonuclease/exonuclease/phosphatase family metal-dependent hydrolase
LAELTVGSYNLHWGRGHRFRGFQPYDYVEACRRIDTDVLVLPECWAPDDGESMQDEIGGALGYEVRFQALSRAVTVPKPEVVERADADPDGKVGTGQWGLAVLTRLPVLREERTQLTQLRIDPSNRWVLTVEVDVDGTPVTVCGTHLAHLEYGVLLRRHELRAALPADDVPALLIGDMNMWTWNMRMMAPSSWRQAGSGRTFSSFVPHSRIDHMVTSPVLEAVATEVLPDLGSDHLPIRGRFRTRA